MPPDPDLPADADLSDGPDLLSDDLQLTAVGLLMEVHGGLTGRLAPVFAAHGLSGNDFDVLIRVARSPGGQLRMSDLAAQTGLSTSGITRVVDRLERSDLVKRQANSDDRRSSRAALTATGNERLSALLPPLVAAIRQWFTGPLEPDQLDAFLTALRTIRATVHPDATSGSQG